MPTCNFIRRRTQRHSGNLGQLFKQMSADLTDFNPIILLLRPRGTSLTT
jgi:hypothetical protein